MKKPYSFKLEPELLPALRQIAELENRSLNNMVEKILIDFTELRAGGGSKKENLNKTKSQKAKK
jgi:hypothetical protein